MTATSRIATVAFLVLLLAAAPSVTRAQAQPPATNPPLVDLHFHWEGKADLDKLLAESAAQGIKLGVTGEGGDTWGLSRDASLTAFLAKLDGKPVYRGLQVYTRNWTKNYSKEALAKLDYVAADALMFPDSNGRVIALWQPNVSFADPEDFMGRYMDYHLVILAEPINIWSNPTFLPESLQSRYDELWTPARMRKLAEAAVKNGVTIEINSRYQIPNLAFLKLAKQLGAKFSFGTNRHDDEPGNLDYCLKMYREVGLTPADLYVPAGARVR